MLVAADVDSVSGWSSEFTGSHNEWLHDHELKLALPAGPFPFQFRLLTTPEMKAWLT